jgi:branched-subunit amino acid permease
VFSYHEHDPALALEFAHQVLKRFQVYGAADTEGYMTVDAIAGVFFGEDAVLHYKGR